MFLNRHYRLDNCVVCLAHTHVVCMPQVHFSKRSFARCCASRCVTGRLFQLEVAVSFYLGKALFEAIEGEIYGLMERRSSAERAL